MKSVLFISLLVALTMRADTLQLKDGSSITGNIVSETDSEVVVESSVAGGTIIRTEHVARTNIAAIARLTPEQRAAQDMEESFLNMQRYRLDPNRSFAIDYYDRVVTGVFQRFLTQYPSSPHERQLVETIEKWTEERRRVAAGQGKYAGAWLPAAEAERRWAQDRDAQILRQARTLLAERAFERAAQQLAGITGPPHSPETIDQIHRLLVEIYRTWQADIEIKKQRLTKDLETTRRSIPARQERKAKAEQDYNELLSRVGSGRDYGRLGENAYLVRARSQKERAAKDLAEAEAQATEIQEQVSQLDQRLTEVRGLAGTAASAAAATATPTSQASAKPTASTPGETPEIVAQVGDAIKRYWGIALIAVAIIAWGCVRIFSR